MPVLSQYWFHNGFFQGPFDVFNEPYPDGGWAWISNGSSSAATLAWNRPDGEHAVDLAAQLNTGDVLAIVDKALGSQASRTSGIMVQGVFWPSVPYYGSDPGRHPASMMLARVYFDFHVPTPWYCSDADGNVAYYLVLYLDASGHAKGYVDGWSYNYSGGGPFCTGTINDLLNKAVPGAIGQVQKVLDDKLGLLAAFTFSTMYYLPGSGTSSQGDHSENADTDLAVAVLS
jgi:hypothetical protein